MLIPAEIPSPDQLAADLRRLIRRRGVPTFPTDSPLLTLALVADRAGSDQDHAREAVLTELLGQLAPRIGPAQGEAVLALLSLAGSRRRSSPGERREAAADILKVGDPDSIRRRPEQPLTDDLATAIIQAEAAHRTRTRELDPTLIDWPGRFAAYGRIYSPTAALGGDLDILIRADRETDDFTYLVAQLASSLWHYAVLLLAIHRFEEEYGGIWLLSDPNAETDAANAIFHIQRHPAFHEYDHFYLRSSLRQTPEQEFEPFHEALASDERGQEILIAWRDWCLSCTCPSLDIPERGCEVHAVITACEDYLTILDRELTTLGQPIREQLREIPVEGVKEIVKRFGAVRGE